MALDPDNAPSAPWMHQASTKYPISPTISFKSSVSSSESSIFPSEAPCSQSSASSSWTTPSWTQENHNAIERTPTGSSNVSKENIQSRSYRPSGLSQGSECIKAVALEARQHPRRTQRLYSQDSQDGSSSTSCLRSPPALVRQSERKHNFVDSLVGKLV